jgi:hypothetical protein
MVTDPPGAGTATSDEKGIFTLASESEGNLTLDVMTDRYPSATFEVKPEQRGKDGDELPVYRLLPGGRIHVVAWDETADTPCFGCSISMALPGSARRIPLLTTDAEGEVTSPVLAPGEYHVNREKVESLGTLIRVQSGQDVRFATVEPGKTAEVRFGERRSTIYVSFTPRHPPAGRCGPNPPRGRKAPRRGRTARSRSRSRAARRSG